MPRWLLSVSCLLAPFALPATAFAQDGCPPGSWFCEEAPEVEVTIKSGGGDADDEDEADPPAKNKLADDDLADTPDDEDVSDAPPKKKKKKKKTKTQVTQTEEADTAVVEDEDSVVIVKKKKHKKKKARKKHHEEEARVDADDDDDGEGRRKGRRERRWRETVGLNLRIEGAAFIPQGIYDDGGGLGGVGASFRWRPSPYFAFDAGTDVVGGTDYHGNGRIEIAGSISGLVYFNPQHRVQVYGIGGVHLSHASVDTEDHYYTGYYGDEGTTFDYAGAHAGLGLEFRLSRHFALFADGMGLIRQELNDDNAPEFRDADTGETTDTSGAALFRTGVTFWW